MRTEEANDLTIEQQREELIALLRKHNIPLEQWGQGNAKTLEHLLTEITEGESTLTVNHDGNLLRTSEGAGVDVFYRDSEGNVLKLKEDRQVFNDGRVRRRTMHSSITEKMKHGEDPELSAKRALQEELGITMTDPMSETDSITEVLASKSYPGLITSFTVHTFGVELAPGQFNPEGYSEVQSDKSTFFIWEPVTVVNEVSER